MRRRNIELEPTEWHAVDGQRRVLIEHHDSSIGIAVGNLLAAEGYAVSHCRGPEARAGKCPLVQEGECERAEEADVIFFGLELSDVDDREVLRSLRSHFAGTPVIVELPVSRIPTYEEELEGCVVVPQPLTRDTLLQAVDRALR
jgi:DNA-binding NtrC family response regulator